MMASSSSSPNLADHLLQDDLPWPSLTFAPTLHHAIGANHHQWSQPLLIDHFPSDVELEVLLSGQPPAAPSAAPQLSSVLMMQELGFQWSNCAVADASMAMLISQQAAAHGHMIKAEEPLKDPTASSCGSGTTVDGAGGLPLAALDGLVLPSVNISRLQKPCPAAAAPPLPGDAFEILASARICKTLLSQAQAAAAAAAAAAASSVAVLHNGGMASLVREQHVPSYGPPAHLQGPSSIHNYKMGVSGSDGAEAEATEMRPGGAAPSSSKKPRLDSTIVPSLKVRKEKLGDRIAALQQLVSPFGKTDTASVLMEAIGYIKFLQDQVETLSGPYMRSSKAKKARATQQRVPSANNGGEKKEEGGGERKPDLRSRGLCLVPLSCTSYVTNENGVWAPPPNFMGN